MAQEKKILAKTCPFASKGLIEKAVQLASESRTSVVDYTLSTRDLVLLLENIYKLDEKLETPLTCIANKFEGSDRNLMVDKIDDTFATKLKAKLKAA
jgi:hypothetical protein